MAGVVFKAEAQIVSRKLRKSARRAEDLSPALREVGEIALRSIRRNFDEGGRPGRWPARATVYKGKRAGNKLLIDTGNLLDSITYAGNKLLIDTGNLLDSITYAVHSHFVDIGTAVKYAATHQFGRGGIPARPFLMLQDEDDEPIREAILDHLRGDLTP